MVVRLCYLCDGNSCNCSDNVFILNIEMDPWILIDLGSGNDRVPESTKPLLEAMLTPITPLETHFNDRYSLSQLNIVKHFHSRNAFKLLCVKWQQLCCPPSFLKEKGGPWNCLVSLLLCSFICRCVCSSQQNFADAITQQPPGQFIPNQINWNCLGL